MTHLAYPEDLAHCAPTPVPPWSDPDGVVEIPRATYLTDIPFGRCVANRIALAQRARAYGSTPGQGHPIETFLIEQLDKRIQGGAP